MQLKTTIPLHTLIGMAKIKNWDNTQSWQKFRGMRIFISWWECIMAQSAWKIVWQFLIKLNNSTQFSNYTSVHLFQENENLCSPTDLYMNIHSRFIHNRPKLEATQMSFSE